MKKGAGFIDEGFKSFAKKLLTLSDEKKEDNMKRFISMIVMCCFLLYYLPSFAQEESSEKNEGQEVEIKPIKSETFSEDALSRKFNTLRKVDNEIKAIDAHLMGKGFSAQNQKGKKNFWGFRETYESQQSQDKKGKKGKLKVIFTTQLQNYSKQGSNDAVALGQVTVTAGENTETYSFFLLAPNGNLEAMEEYKVDQNLNISRANSWWSCVKHSIKERCKSCPRALAICLGTMNVVAYVSCVAVTCGWCVTSCMVCCTCNCRWYCFRCCRQ